MYGSFGGHVEFGESPVEAVRREAREELGIEVKSMRFVSCTNFQQEGKHYIDISFVVESFEGVPHIMEPDKLVSLDWHDMDNLLNPLFEPVAIALHAISGDQYFFEYSDREKEI